MGIVFRNKQNFDKNDRFFTEQTIFWKKSFLKTRTNAFFQQTLKNDNFLLNERFYLTNDFTKLKIVLNERFYLTIVH